MWGYLDDLRLFFVLWCCSWVPCLFWTVKLSTVLQKNPPCPADPSVLQHLLYIWTLSSSDCMILRSIFSHWGQLRNSNTTIKIGSNIHWCSRRTHDALRAGGWKLLNRMKMSNIFLILLKYLFFFHLVLPFRSNRRYLDVSRKKKISAIYLDLQIQKVITPCLLQFFPIANTLKWHAQHNYLNWHTESKTSSQVSKSLNTFSAIHTFCISKWHFLNTLNTVLCITHNNLK